MNKKFKIKDFIVITLLTSIWVNVSELIRYFGYVRPQMQDYLSTIPNMGAIWDIQIIAVWGFWDTLASWNNLPVVLPMALLETLVASYIASKLYLKKTDNGK